MTARLLLLTSIVIAGPACKSQVTPSLDRIRSIDVRSGGERPLEDLDVTGDKRIDEADWSLFEQVATAARVALERAGTRVGPRVALYTGPAKNVSAVFSLITDDAGRLDVSRVPAERLEELMIESRWAAQQARLATLAPGALDRPFGGVIRGRVPGYDPEEMAPAAVCAALGKLDLAPFESLGLPMTAVFDLDSTVWDGNVTDVFLALLAERKLPKPESNGGLAEFLKTVPGIDPKVVEKNDVSQNAALLLRHHTDRSLPEEQRVDAKDAFYNIVTMLAGLTREQVQPIAKAAFDQGSESLPPWKDRLFADRSGCGMREIIGGLEKRGIRVYLLSATLDILAEEGGRLFGIPPERVLGSVLEIKDGRYTGKVADSTYYIKGSVVRQWLPAPPLFAFGDSPSSDFGMLLESAGLAFMVNPRPRWKELDDSRAGSRLVALVYEATEGTLAVGND